MQTPPIRNMDGTWARNNEQKAFRFAEYLEKVLQPDEADDIMPLLERMEKEAIQIPFVTTAQVKKEIKNNINQKSSQL